MTLNDKKLELSDREKELRQRIKELSTLYEVNKVLAATLELDDALKLIVETTANMMEVKACGLRLLDKLTGEMVLKAVHGLSQEYIDKGRVFVWKGLYKGVIHNGHVAIVDDIAMDPRFEYTEQGAAEGIKSMLSVGLTIRGDTIGALSVYTAQSRVFTEEQIQIFKGIANEVAVVIERALLYEECIENQRMDQELNTAASIQINLMPQENPKLPGYQIAAKNIPSRMVGGDFYDFISFDESHLGIIIADVSGKGIPGAILMASARATLRAYLEEPHGVEWPITRLNEVLCRDTRPDQFVSLFYGILDVEDETFTYVNAGHNPPILFLDEPTSGVDPQARRGFWNLLYETVQTGKTIFVTTHYMEEADYLCQRVAIMDFGKIVVQDSPENLKNILGGDVISIKAVPSEKAFEAFKKLPWIKKISRHNGTVSLNVEEGEKKIPLLIKTDQEEGGFEIQSINLRKPTLEDVFLHFTGKMIREAEARENEKKQIYDERDFEGNF